MAKPEEAALLGVKDEYTSKPRGEGGVSRKGRGREKEGKKSLCAAGAHAAHVLAETQLISPHRGVPGIVRGMPH